MRLFAATHPLHLTYCLNIHPGESREDVLAAVRTHAVAVRDAVGRPGAFGLGLRLGRDAAAGFRDPAARRELQELLAAENFYVFTVNAFPYGRFHGAAVKKKVYQPDWRDPERLAYTLEVADLLAALLPEAVDGSISTVPGGYGADFAGPEDDAAAWQNLARAALALAALRRRTGRLVRLAVEPAPDCHWESAAAVAAAWSAWRRAPAALCRLATASGASSAAALENALDTHLGLCLDTCHSAVVFEPLPEALAALAAAAVPLVKIQISAAPMARISAETLAQLAPLAEPVYLHQTRIRPATGPVLRFPDLAPALAAARDPALAGCELRTHFHIPLGLDGFGGVGSSRRELDSAFFACLRGGLCPHVELETYSFSVLPEPLRAQGVTASLAAEYAWFLAQFLHWHIPAAVTRAGVHDSFVG